MYKLTMVGALFLAACGGTAEGDTTAQGRAVYPDESAPPEQNASDPMTVDVRVEGSGTLSGLEPQCELEGAGGNFTGLLSGEGELDGNGGYVAVLATSNFTTPSGACDIPDLQIGTLTSVVVHAALSNTEENCSSYCAAKASDAAAEASCATSCTEGDTNTIVAESSVGITGLAALNASQVTGTVIGEIEADLTFDHIEDGEGDTVSED